MIQFNINGNYIDLPQTLELQFTKKNIIFAFDDIEVSRSTAFNIPATANNNRVFNLGNDAARDGESVRQRHAAQMQYSGGAIDGYLYVTSAAKDYYSVCFVFGELLQLKAMKDAGKIGDYLDLQDNIIYGDSTTPHTAIWAALTDFESVYYHNAVESFWQKGTLPMPSVRLSYLLNECAKYFNATLNLTSEDATYLQHTRILTSTINDLSKEYSQRIVKKNRVQIGTSDGAPIYETPFAGESNINDLFFSVEETEPIFGYMGDYESGNYYYDVVQYLQARQKMRIKFPDNFPSDIELYSINVGATRNLAGKTIDIMQGQGFYFNYVDKGALIVKEPLPYDYTFSVMGYSDSIEYGGRLFLQPNLPEITFIDLLKSAAALCGKCLYYDGASNSITFDDCNFSDWSVLNIDKLITIKEISRKFADYARINSIVFDSDNYIKASEQLAQNYFLKNENIEREKVLLQIPFSEGRQYDSTTNAAFINDIIREESDDGKVAYKLQADKQSILYCGSDYYMERVAFKDAQWLKRLLDISTAITIQCIMPLYQYDRISAKTLLRVDGQIYVWTESQWGNNIATFNLNKVVFS